MLKKIINKQNLLSIGILLAIAAFTHMGWVFANSVFTSGDWHFISNEKYSDFVNFSPVWVVDNLGTTSATPHFYLIRFFEGILTQLGVGFAITEKVFFFLPIILGSSLGTYYFLKRYFSPRFAVLGAIVYMFNTPFLFNHAGPLTIAVVYALAPVIMGIFARYLDNPKNLRLALLLGVVFSISIYYELRCTLLVAMTMFLYLLFRLVTSRVSFREILQILKGLTLTAILTVVLNLFWLIPYFFASKDITFADRLTQGLFTTFSDLSNALTLHHPFWTGERPAKFITQDIPFYFWIVPVYAFAGIFISKIKGIHREIFFWALVSLFGVFLVKQVNEPFVDFYPWIFKNIPGFAAYRESSKFYIFIVLGYSVLIPWTAFSIHRWFRDRFGLQSKSIYIANLLYIIPFVLFLSNAIPLVNNTFKTMYVERSMPEDYLKLNSFIADQDEYFRTLWYPTASRWSIQHSQHPALNAVSLTKGEWLNKVFNTNPRDATLRDKSTNLFTDSLSNEILDKLAIKYVIIPIRDIENDDDFITDYGNSRQYYINVLDNIKHLKKVNIGTEELLVYENLEYSDYIEALDTVQLIDSIDNVNSYTNLTSEILGADLNFITNKTPTEYYKQSFQDIFNINSTLDIENTIEFKELDSAKIYKDKSQVNLQYVIRDNKFILSYIDDDGIQFNGQSLDTSRNELAPITLSSSNSYYLLIDDQLVDVPIIEGSRELGMINISTLRFFESSKNQSIESSHLSFDDGLWLQDTENCGDQLSNTFSNITLEDENRGHKGKQHIKISTFTNPLCVISKELTLDSDKYVVSFDFKTENTQNIGYNLLFNNAERINKVINASANSWAQHRDFIELPKDIETAQIQLTAYNNYQLKEVANTYYDHVSIKELKEIDLDIQDPSFFEFIVDEDKLNVQLDELLTNDQVNIFGNGSFDDGLWEEKVSDCNNYNEKPQIYMELVDTESRDNVLQLSAQNNAACTTQRDIPVLEGQKYILRFKYQSPNAQYAKYHVSFNDDERTLEQEIMPFKSKDWVDHTKVLKVPYGATSMNLTVYSYGLDTGRSTVVNNYDEFTLSPFKELSNKYFLVDENTSIDSNHATITYASVHNAKKQVSVTGASKSFYISFNESYNTQWKLMPQSSQNSFNPFEKSAYNSDQYHFLLNGNQNGWYIDIQKLCIELSECTKNSDGTYDLQFSIEFMPQRWVYIGSIIGITTLASVIYYLSYCYLFAHTKSLKKINE
jgi:hypothetical protein